MTTETVKNFRYDEATVMRDRVDAVEAYFDSWDSQDIDAALRISDQIDIQGKPLPTTIAIIPVAAHVEASKIQRALGWYAGQVTADPFAVHLHMNWPKETEEETAIEASFEAVEASQAAFPELDIRVSATAYDKPTIGSIRRAAWNGTLASLYEQSSAIATAIGMNHDIDLISMSPRYVSRSQRYYTSQAEPDNLRPFMQPAGTETRHALSQDLPNISKAVYWMDFTSRMYKIGYEAGLIIPFATYAQRGGFRNGDITYESRALTFDGQQNLEQIKGTRLETSARRYHDRLPTNGYGMVWTNESFSADDPCRSRQDFTDISDAELHVHIAEDAKHFPSYYIRRLLRDGLSFEQYVALAENDPVKTEQVTRDVLSLAQKAARLTGYALAHVIGAEDVADYLVAHGFHEDSVRYEMSLRLASMRTIREYVAKDSETILSPTQR